MSHLRYLAAAVVLVGGVTVQAAPQKAPDLADLVKRAGEYFEKYTSRVSGVSMDEQLMLIETSSGDTRVPVRLASDLVFVKIDSHILGLRDPYSIDARRLRERNPRIINALLDPTPANWQLAQRYVRENANLLMHNVVVWYSDPALALQFISPANQSRLTYKLEGTKKINGVQVQGVGFKEIKGGEPILSQVPGRAESSGRFWIDPATGDIHMTELWVQSETDNIRVLVNYAPDQALKILLPRSAAHTFEWREMGSGTITVGRANMKVSFEATAEYKNARYTPIDLARAGK